MIGGKHERTVGTPAHVPVLGVPMRPATGSEGELLRLPAVGVRIRIAAEGWETTIVRFDAHTKMHREQTCPLRVSFELARHDARRYAPFVLLGVWDMTMCRRRLLSLECGEKVM